MNQFKNLLAIDLSSYGAAFAIINQFADDESVKVFEVSPCGQSGILILLAKDSVSLQIIRSEISSYFKNQILSCTLIENMHESLLPTYLSQNKTDLKKSLVIFEGAFVSEGLVLANRALTKNNLLADFRVIRTFPKNVVITLTVDNVDLLADMTDLGFKKTVIENAQPVVKSYFEI